MRYTVGKKYYFVNIEFTAGRPRFGRLYIPWQDTLHGIEVLELTCTEHHKVSGEWDDELKYDGFRFVDANGKIWNNQYPRASYGQLDDSRDGMVTPDFDGMSTEEAMPLFEKYRATEDVVRYLDNILRGLRDLKKAGNLKEAKSLKIHFNAIVRALRPFGVTVETKPWIARYTDGTPDKVLHHMLRAHVVPLGMQNRPKDRIRARRRRKRKAA